MPLSPATRIGPYEIAAQIGRGGMGEVYRAIDMNLKRAVAIKVLPGSVATDPDRIARFQREAEILAALDHPNIARIHGLETSTTITALVMELVDGPTLADRVAQGALPLDEALAIAKQIAHALEAAHRQGIIHRDLKPANIKLKPDGTVKVLDFGLAKAMDPAATAVHGASASTITAPPMTAAGLMFGTAAYMSPEHVRGQAVDQRADLWAFGCILFEMLTGVRPFTGESMTEILATVLMRVPDWSLLPADVPPPIRVLLRRCLEKNPTERLGDIAAASVLIDELPALTTPTGLSQSAFSRGDRGPRGALMKAMGGGLALAVLTGVGVWLAIRPAAPTIVKTMVTPSGPTVLSVGGFDRDVAITPDGSRIVYRGADQLLVRWLDSLEPTVIVRGVRPQGVFVSPDGQWIGFFDENSTLRKVAVTGGPATVLDTTTAPFPRGATWGNDDTIVFGKNGNLYRVPSSGGESMLLASPDRSTGETAYMWPEFLPGSQAVLFTIVSSDQRSRVAAFDLRTRTSKVLLPGGGARYVASGHLVYRVDANVLAVPFDPDRLALTGAQVVVLRDIAITAGGGVNAAVSQAGTLVYVPGAGSVADERVLVWVDRMGREQLVPVEPRTYQIVRLSPDGAQAAVDVRDGENDVWTYSFGAGTLTRLSSAPGNDMFPVWTQDNQRVIFSAAPDATGRRGLVWRATDGSTPVARLLDGSFRPYGLTPDGSTLLLQSADGVFAFVLSPDGRQKSTEPTPLLDTPHSEQNAEVSPDGHWVAYQSNDSGRDEVYVRPYPNVEASRISISTSGGRAPLWSRSGNELFYVTSDGAVMGVPVNRGPVWRHGPAAQVVAPGYFHAGEVMRTFDVSLDGRRFLMIKQTAGAAGTPRSIVVVQNWFAELARLLPAN